MVHGVPVKVEAALSDTLSTPVLLSRDVPELPGMLNQGGVYAKALKEEEAMAITRAGSGRDSTAQEEAQGTRERTLKLDTEQQDLDEEGATIMGQEGRKEEERTEGTGAGVPDPEPLGSTFAVRACWSKRAKTKATDPGPETSRQPELQTRTAKGGRGRGCGHKDS